jgi:hypothetical protein
MGTNLLNLFPSSQTSELVVVPGYGYLAGHAAVTPLAHCFLLSVDPDLPLQLVTAVTFGSPFEILADSFPEGVAISPAGCSHLAMKWLPGYFRCLATLVSFENFPRLAPRSALHFKLQLP